LRSSCRLISTCALPAGSSRPQLPTPFLQSRLAAAPLCRPPCSDLTQSSLPRCTHVVELHRPPYKDLMPSSRMSSPSDAPGTSAATTPSPLTIVHPLIGSSVFRERNSQEEDERYLWD
jgi:hypothetical protein